MHQWKRPPLEPVSPHRRQTESVRTPSGMAVRMRPHHLKTLRQILRDGSAAQQRRKPFHQFRRPIRQVGQGSFDVKCYHTKAYLFAVNGWAVR